MYIEDNRYRNKLSFPDKKDYTTVYVYSKGKVIWNGNLRNYDTNEHKGVVERIIDTDAYNTAVKLFNRENERLHQLFKSDLEEYHGTKNAPKKDVLYSKAYELGHSGGYSEVANYYEDLVELIE